MSLLTAEFNGPSLWKVSANCKKRGENKGLSWFIEDAVFKTKQTMDNIFQNRM